MNLGQTRVAVRARTTAELVDLACRVPFALGGALYLRLAAFTLLPAAALCLAAVWSGASRVQLWLLAGACFGLIQGPFTIAISRLMFSSTVSVRSVLGQFARAALRFVFGKLMALTLLIGGATLVLVVPIVVARLLYVGEVMLVEGTGVVASYRRSMRLNANRVGPALAMWSALAGMAFAFVVCAHVLIDALGENLLGLSPVSIFWEKGPNPLSCLGLLGAAPFVATARFLAYIDSRTRREAWDVQVDFMRLAQSLEGKA